MIERGTLGYWLASYLIGLSLCTVSPIGTLAPGDRWLVTSVSGMEVVPGRQPFFSFAPDEMVTGNGGCNDFFATYRIDGESLIITGFSQSIASCGNERAQNIEDLLFKILQDDPQVARTGNLLTLSSSDGVIQATFVKLPP